MGELYVMLEATKWEMDVGLQGIGAQLRASSRSLDPVLDCEQDLPGQRASVHKLHPADHSDDQGGSTMLPLDCVLSPPPSSFLVLLLFLFLIPLLFLSLFFLDPYSL
ncbi:hypothetical protein FKM82_021927 [Ascaphus truei]